MTQKVIKVGSSAAVVIPKKSLKELGIKVGDDVSIKINPSTQTVLVKAVAKKDRRAERITKLGIDFINRYRVDLERLANE